MSDLSFSVSQMDVFRAWEQDPEADMGWLIKALTTREETDDMRRGLAFHKALETIGAGEMDQIESSGYRFLFDGDFVVPLFPFREARGSKKYTGVEVKGRVDGIHGNLIIDHKASTWFDAEKYFKKYQWRYYLDIFKADKFKWYIWEMQEADDPMTFIVRDCHILEQFRYPDLEQDCKELAMRMKLFAEQYLIEA